jgi:hypothetical protein
MLKQKLAAIEYMSGMAGDCGLNCLSQIKFSELVNSNLNNFQDIQALFRAISGLGQTEQLKIFQC